MVIKFTPEGRVAMVFGRKQEASDEETGPLKHPNPPLPAEPGRFRQVTDIALDAADNTFISDGYINSRVAKVDKDGNWIKSWGERGTGPGQFNTPHAIAIDAKGNVYVADRGNHRIQVFDSDGNFLRQIVIDVPVPPDAKPAIGNIPSEAPISRPAPSRRARRGPSASRRRRTRCSTAPTPVRAASTSSVSTARSRHARAKRQAARTVRLDPRAGLPVGERAVGRRAVELAGAKADLASVGRHHRCTITVAPILARL